LAYEAVCVKVQLSNQPSELSVSTSVPENFSVAVAPSGLTTKVYAL
jgi:hypothetical protein